MDNEQVLEKLQNPITDWNVEASLSCPRSSCLKNSKTLSQIETYLIHPDSQGQTRGQNHKTPKTLSGIKQIRVCVKIDRHGQVAILSHPEEEYG